MGTRKQTPGAWPQTAAKSPSPFLRRGRWGVRCCPPPRPPRKGRQDGAQQPFAGRALPPLEFRGLGASENPQPCGPGVGVAGGGVGGLPGRDGRGRAGVPGGQCAAHSRRSPPRGPPSACERPAPPPAAARAGGRARRVSCPAASAGPFPAAPGPECVRGPGEEGPGAWGRWAAGPSWKSG